MLSLSCTSHCTATTKPGHAIGFNDDKEKVLDHFSSVQHCSLCAVSENSLMGTLARPLIQQSPLKTILERS